MADKPKVAVAISGGVDSAVALALLTRAGYQTQGIFMKNWSGDNFGLQVDCPWEQDQKDAEAICKTLGVPFRSLNLEKAYREKVVEYFFTEFRAGRTPNPDVMCNREIKFGIFLEKALELGADLIATGHYAQVRYNQESKMYELLKGNDQNKDQSYFLNRINQEQLAQALFPIGHLPKPEVRKIAQELKLPVATKPDSQGICFIGEINVQKFLRANIAVHAGQIIDIETNTVVGTHDGIEFYTIGQRGGLNIGGAPLPYYVAKKDKDNNILYVAKGNDNSNLFSKTVLFSELNVISRDLADWPSDISAAVRYRQKPAPGRLNLEQNCFEFLQPQRAIASGQSIVFYDKDVCLGGAIIEN